MCVTRILLAFGLIFSACGLSIGQSTHLSSTLSKGSDSSPVTLKLSEALKSFKSVFDVDILFEDKLVEGVVVSKELLNPKESVEVNLANLLNVEPTASNSPAANAPRRELTSMIDLMFCKSTIVNSGAAGAPSAGVSTSGC